MGHPMKARKDWRPKVVPLFLHGDGVDVSRKRQLDGLAACSFTQTGCPAAAFFKAVPFCKESLSCNGAPFFKAVSFCKETISFKFVPSSMSTHPPCRHLHHMRPASELHFPRM